jgi:hypothetical protein
MDGREFLALADPDEDRRLQAELDRFIAAVARKHKRKPDEVLALMLGIHWDELTDELRAEETEKLARVGLAARGESDW